MKLEDKDLEKANNALERMLKLPKKETKSKAQFIHNNIKKITLLKNNGYTYKDISEEFKTSGVIISASEISRSMKINTKNKSVSNKKKYRKITNEKIEKPIQKKRHVTTEDDDDIFKKTKP